MMKLPSLAAVVSLVALIGCGKSPTTASTSPTPGLPTGSTTGGLPVAPKGVSKLKELTKEDVKIGDGILQGIKVGANKGVENGDLASFSYTGKLHDGKVFDTNITGSKINGQPTKHDRPLVFTVGRGQVIPGLDQGVLGMKIGGVRKVGIPPSMGYGQADQGQGVIPGNSDLHFEIKCLDIVKKGEEGVFDYKQLAEGSGRPIKEGDTLQVEYTVRLADGKIVDTNVGKAPYEFTIGEIPPRVISGLEKGVVGMKKGGVRLLRIPPQIGYGTKLVSAIPPNSTLVIQVKILEVM